MGLFLYKKPNPAQERGNQIINSSVKAAWQRIVPRSIKVIGVNYKRRLRQDREERVYLHPNPTANLAGEKREECLFG